MNVFLKPDEIVEIVRANYSLDKIKHCMFIIRGMNDSYFIATSKEKYVFRVYLNNKYFIKSDSAYRFELDLLAYLHQNNVPVANALANINGKLLGTVQTTLGDRSFALFPYAEGIPLASRSITSNQCYNIGKYLAKIHQTSNSFITTHKRYRLDLKYLIEQPLKLISEGAETKGTNPKFDELIAEGERIVGMLQPLDNYIERINNISLNSDQFGIIHADLHPGNMHFYGDEVTIFDFDHCGFGWRAYDLAIAYHYPTTEQRDSIISGYESLRPLSDEERDSLQDFANLRNLWNIGDIIATETLRDL
ncbi:homoserine kinase [Marinomonas sp. 2405UD68-3]|uniref:homoserine kinase n=1 Tax=Marinomonas sp. 2405UD68-3 TaxID=3391835 RepID=UPI0039C935AB